MQAVDLLVSARWVIPVDPPETVLADHGVAVAVGRILAVLPTAEAARAALAAGIRAALGIIALEFPTPYAADADDYIAKASRRETRSRKSRSCLSAWPRTRPTR